MNLVFLHGAPAAGKLTTARELTKRLGYPVFHNHLIVDLLMDIFPFGSDPFVRLREEMWMAVFAEAARVRRSLVFTFAPEGTVPTGFAGRVSTVVEREGGRVIFVKLLVSPEQQEDRIENMDRSEFHKIANLQTLRTLRQQDGDVDLPPVDLEIDTDVSAASDSADCIIRHFGLVPEPHADRYPPTPTDRFAPPSG
jgi:hypothetical protein